MALSDSNTAALKSTLRPPSFERAKDTLYGDHSTTNRQRDAALHDLITLYGHAKTPRETCDKIVDIFVDAVNAGDIRSGVERRFRDSGLLLGAEVDKKRKGSE